MDLIEKILMFEAEKLSTNETIELFSELINTGIAWKLQGFYERTAQNFINSGVLDNTGNMLRLEDEN